MKNLTSLTPFLCIGLLFFLPILVGCQKNTATDSEGTLVGKWKLVKGVYYAGSENETQIEDYSSSQTIYEFSADGYLNVSSEMEDEFRFKSGKYAYQINESAIGEPAYVVKIGEKDSYFITPRSREMTIEMIPANSLALYSYKLTAYFVRTQ